MGFGKKKKQYGNTNTSSKHVFLENLILFKINIKRLGTYRVYVKVYL